MLLSSSNTSPDGNPGFDASDVVAAAGDITFNRNGHITDQSGSFYVLNAPAGATEYFEVEVWLGNFSSYSQAIAGGEVYFGVTSPFAEVLASNLSPILTGIGNRPTIDLAVIPEPSTLAMACVGIGSMLIFRSRKS
jgi:hypothetical protein